MDSAVSARAPFVSTAVDRIQNLVSRAEGAAEAFEKRLTPVMRSAIQIAHTPGGKPSLREGTATPLADALESTSARLEQVLDGLQSMLDRLEI